MNHRQNLLTKPLVAAFLATICQILWGIVFPIIKKCYELFSIGDVFSTYIFAGLRFIIAGIALLLVSTAKEKKLPILSKETLPSVLLLGTLQTGFVYALQFAALVTASSINCSVINGTSAMVSTISARILYKDEKLSFRKILGLVLGFGGILFCFLYKGDGMTHFALLGEGLMICSVLFFNFSAAFSKTVTKRVDPIITSGYNLLVGGVEILVLGLLFHGHISSGGALGTFLFLFISAISAVCFLIWTALLASNGVAKIAVFQGINPIAGAIAAALILNENVFQIKYVVATLLVVSGIMVLNVEPKKRI